MTPRLVARGVGIPHRLQATDLTLEAGALIALVGPNGGGKTSVLRALAGVERSSGEVRVDGERLIDAPPARRALLATFLPASRDLAWPIAARDVIALGLPAPEPDRVDKLIDLFELRPFADRPVDQLSTGERARVLFARALAPRPKLLLLDEPLSNLDPYWVLRMLDILRGEVSRGATALVSLHDIERLGRFDRVLLIAGGRVLADDLPAPLLASAALANAFGIERLRGGEWAVRPQADRQSSR